MPATLIQRRLLSNESPVISGISPILERVCRARGVCSETEVRLSVSALLLPDTLKGMDQALALLKKAIVSDWHILIVGDFDADGATSTTLMLLALRAFGAKNVDYLVPNRFDYGYGLTPAIVELASQRSAQLIVTVDNGISSLEGVALAKALGMAVLITDHHLPGKDLPLADAIVNPNQPDCDFPEKSTAGVGVAFYVLSGLRKTLREAGWFEAQGIVEPQMAAWLDLVALGTVADVVSLDANNRILVQEGLRRIRSGRCRPGIKALLRIAGKSLPVVSSMDLAFQLAPRLNAAGRLDDMSLGIECLLAGEEGRALDHAMRLDAFNRERRDIEKQMKMQAEAFLDLDAPWLNESDLPMGVCLYHDDWHQGVVGILASRIKERLNRPVIAFARGDDGEIKGSARSVPELNIRDLLDTIATRHPDMLSRFGGHAMAAGLTLEAVHFERFKQVFNESVQNQLGRESRDRVLVTDGEINQVPGLEEVRELLTAMPWGQGFPEPLFDGEFEILSQKIVGGNHLKMRLRDTCSGEVWEAIAFNQGEVQAGKIQRMAYRLSINDFNGMESLQLIIEAMNLELVTPE
ncbi:MAG: single-stranded-DNA-specific exonuclease RecJ [Gammaproteobacteria bacterium]|nr:single-stranded-DNA-specific exonuclease RecJ [Gammaproteobacteria bacterium]